MGAHARAILRVLRRSRRRAILVRWLRYAVGAALILAASTVVGLAMGVARAPAPVLPALLGLAVLIFGLAAAAALCRAPSLGDTARDIDNHLALEQRLETSFDGLAEPDEVAKLLRRDTTARLAGFRPAELYPLDLGRGSRPIWAVSAMLLAAALVLRIAVLPERAGGPVMAERPIAGRGAPETAAPAPTGAGTAASSPAPAGDAGEPPGNGAKEAQPGPAGPDRSGRAAAPGPPRPDGETAPGQADDPPPAIDRGGPATEAPPGGPAGEEAADRSADSPEPAAPVGEQRLPAGGTDPGSGPGRLGPTAWPLAAASARDIGFGRVSEAGTGLVREDDGKAAESGGGRGPESSSGPGAVAAIDEAAWDSIEAALADESLPAGLERFVRAYFAALRKEGP